MADVDISIGLEDAQGFQGVLDAITGGIKDLGREVEAAAANFRSFESEAASIGTSVELLTGMTGELADVWRDFDKAQRELDVSHIKAFAATAELVFTPLKRLIADILEGTVNLGSDLGRGFAFGFDGLFAARATRQREEEAERNRRERQQIFLDRQRINEEFDQRVEDLERRSQAREDRLIDRQRQSARRQATSDEIFDFNQELDRETFGRQQQIDFGESLGREPLGLIFARQARDLASFNLRQQVQGQKRDFAKAARADDAQIRAEEELREIKKFLQTNLSRLEVERNTSLQTVPDILRSIQQ